LLASSVSAVPVLCSARAEFSKKLAVEVADVPVDDVDVVEDELVDEFEELEELPALEEFDVVDAPDVVDELEEGVVGWKKVLPEPNPKFAALVPPTVIIWVSFSPLMTSLPVLSSHAATCALP
jgi:hypothetical protein